MSSSPLPPDPYEALGISKDSDADTVKKTHRKLVLKHHPDRIKDPALVEQGKSEFQKVQQAYELLIDPVKRQRYDDQVKLAQLRKERMLNERMSEREMPRPTYTKTTYAARPSPAPTQPVQREMRNEPRYAYEERTPESYFDRSYEDPLPRANARKDPYEKRPSVSKPVEKRKEEKKASAWDRPAAGIGLKMALNLKEKAQAAKAKVKQQEMRAKDAKARDKDERRERSEKHTHTHYASPRVDDYMNESSGSESDTVVANSRNSRDPRARSPQPGYRTYSPEPMSRARSPRPMARERSPKPSMKSFPSTGPYRRRQPSPQPSDSGSDSNDDWERHHRDADAYIARSRVEARIPPRPALSRQGSENVYWAAGAAREPHKSGSESDRNRPASSHKHPRRTIPPENGEAARRPPLHHGATAPAGVKAAARTLERELPLPRARQGSWDARPSNHRKEMFGEVPPLQRTSSDPVSPSSASRRANLPTRGSTLKETQTHQHDSGYGSSSAPHTPEMREDSPPRTWETKTTYRARKDEGETHRARKMTDDGGEMHKFLSREMAETQYHANHAHEENRERRRSRSRDPMPRQKSPELRRKSPEARRKSPEPHSRSSRPAMGERRASFSSRTEASSRYDEPRSRRPNMERSSESFMRRVDPKAVKYASHAAPSYTPRYDDRHAESQFHRTREGTKIRGC